MATKKPKSYLTPSAGAVKTARSYNVPSAWRTTNGRTEKLPSGIRVFVPVDPYKAKERKEFRTALENPYVYRACRIQTGFVTGDGYSLKVSPRKNEEIPADQREAWANSSKVFVPLWNRECTPEEIKDWFADFTDTIGLQTNVFNAYFTSLEQGRAVIAFTPLEKVDGEWLIPNELSYIRTEHLMMPVIDDSNGKLVGVRCVAALTDEFQNMIPVERMIYLEHGFNNALFSDHYGDSKVARIADEANNLNIIMNEDYLNAAKHSWYKPRVWAVPIPPEEYGNEGAVLTQFTDNVNEGEGKDVAVTGPATKDEQGVQLLSNDSSGSASAVQGLEVVRSGIIKSIITAFGMPSFMLAEGDLGTLGGNSHIEELDSYINTEIKPERLTLETALEKQFYDIILCLLFQVEDPKDCPIRIIHKFNKPKLWTLLTPEMFNVLSGMVSSGWIDEDGLREFLGLEEFDKQTVTRGAEDNPGQKPWPITVPSSPPTVNNWNQKPLSGGWGTNKTDGWPGDASPISSSSGWPKQPVKSRW